VHEIPHRSIIDLKTARGEFGHQSAQGEGAVPDAPRQKDRVLAGDRLGLVPAYLTWSDAARLAKAPDPIDHRARHNAKSRRRLMPREPALQNRPYRALPKIHRIRLSHPYWPPFPARTVNQNSADSGIPPRFSPNSSRSSLVQERKVDE
jgi:hypothetical protein